MTRETLPSAANQSVGQTVVGKYAISRLLGEGGMGAVYEAEHIEIGKKVAIKLVRSLRGQEDESGARFIREARAASVIDNDHIVQIFDVGQDPNLGLYMIMELLPGRDLGALLGRTGKLDPPLACAIIDQAANALEAAHAAGVIHRDLKPENVFLKVRDDGSATVKLVDFGIAKVVRDARSGAVGGVITRSGSVLGSPCYMSPEQAQGLPDVDYRTDIYSLGAVLYEMLVGKRAFVEKATYEQTIVPIITQQAPRVSQTVKTISPKIDQLVADMMAPSPDDRPGTMGEVRKRLQLIQPGVDETRLRIAALEKGARGTGSPSDVATEERAPRTGAAVVTDQSEAKTLLQERIPVTGPRPGVMIASAVGILVAAALGTFYAVRPKPVPQSAEASPAATATPSLPETSAAPLPVRSEPTASAKASSSSAADATDPSPSASAQAAAPATASAKARPRPPPRSPPPTGGQVGGVGITTAF